MLGSSFASFCTKLNVFTKEELIGKIISLNIKNAKTPRIIIDRKKDSINKEIRELGNTMSKLIINIGRSNRIDPETLIRLINKTVRSRNTEIGKINIKKNHATFEVDNRMKNTILSKMQHIRHNGKKILVSNYNPDTMEFETKRKRKPLKRRR